MKRLFYSLCILLAIGACSSDNDEKKVLAEKVELNYSEKDISVGDEAIKLIPTILPKDANIEGIWSSSNASIAKVDQKGYVKPISEGEATILFTMKNNLQTYCKIKVHKKSALPTEIKLSETRVRIIKGETFQLDAILSPKDVTIKDVIWESYNEDIVSVSDDGELKALNYGHGIVIAETANRYRAKCFVSVVRPDFKIPENLYGTWTGIRMELISQSDGKVYDEKAVGGLLSDGTDVEAWLESVRTSYEYILKEDGELRMYMALKGGEFGFIKGTIGDSGYSNVYSAKFTTDKIYTGKDENEEGMGGIDSFGDQSIHFDGKLVSIQIPFGSSFDLKVYYKITK